MVFWLCSVTQDASFELYSTVRLGFRENVFQTIRKLADTDFQYHIGVFIVYISTFLQKKIFFFLYERNFTLTYGPFSCLIVVLFGPIFMENFVHFFNARSFLKLMRCNSNIKKLYKPTLLSSDCRAWWLKLSEHLKKGQNMLFLILIFKTPTLTKKIPHFFSIFFLQNISYP